MRRSGRIALLGASHLLVAIAAAAVGAAVGALYLQDSFARRNAMANHMILISRYATYAELQRSKGGPEVYRDALLTFLAAMDQVHASAPDDPLYNEHAYWADKTLTYTRLARVGRSTGNRKEADEYLAQAVASCASTGWKDCAPETLIEITEQLEQHAFGAANAKRTEP